MNNAYERLKLDIMNSELPPGFQAPEPEIAERLGMSRTPVREALIRLEADGLVELVPRRGAKVCGMGHHDMLEIYDLLCVLEPMAMRRLCQEDQQIPADVLTELDDLVAAIGAAEAADDIDAWGDAELAFRRKLINLGTNRRLAVLLETLFDQLYRGRLVLLRLMPMPKVCCEKCAEILEAVKVKDADRAEALMLEYRQTARQKIDNIFHISRLVHV